MVDSSLIVGKSSFWRCCCCYFVSIFIGGVFTLGANRETALPCLPPPYCFPVSRFVEDTGGLVGYLWDLPAEGALFLMRTLFGNNFYKGEQPPYMRFIGEIQKEVFFGAESHLKLLLAYVDEALLSEDRVLHIS